MATVLIAPDKFRGTATAPELCGAVAAVLRGHGDVELQPLSDGGEGFRQAFVGIEHRHLTAGPLGGEVAAPITVVDGPRGRQAVLEAAEVIGRQLLPSPTSAQALQASSAPVGQLILAAAHLGAEEILLGVGGTATSDGGEGAYEFLTRHGGLPCQLTVATDVVVPFAEAIRFAPQKGVAEAQLDRVAHHFTRLRERYAAETGIDIGALARGGAAGGLAGALAALGATLADGFTTVAEATDLSARLDRADLVVTGEGHLDLTTLEGKVVDALCALAPPTLEVLCVAGVVDPAASAALRERYPQVEVVSLEERYGPRAARHDTAACFAACVDAVVRRRSS